MSSPVRFSSCRGVAFEIKPHADPFLVTTSPPLKELPPFSSERLLPWSQESRSWLTSSTLTVQSMSKPSSHSCDLELEQDEDDEYDWAEHFLGLLEEGDFKVEEIPKPASDPPPAVDPLKENVPHKQNTRLAVILLDQGLLTVYKRLFAVCLMLNITGLVLAAMGRFPYARNRAGLFSIANIFALTLCRSEATLRVVFWIAVKILGHTWIPLFVKTASTPILQSLGGIHSGCGMSSIAWLVYALALTVKDRGQQFPRDHCRFIHPTLTDYPVGYSCISARATLAPQRLRKDTPVRWMVVPNPSVGVHLFDHLLRSELEELLCPDLVGAIITTATTVLIIFPWLTVRRVSVSVTSPSCHTSIIKFRGGVKPGILGRISPSPLFEWHTFGIISNGKDDHMMLAGAVGDFTKSLITSPPSHLWVRQVHFAGLAYLVNMYDRVLLVATGSGICVFLSFLLQPCRVSVCVLWIAKGIEQNFGKEIKEMMRGHPRGKVIVHNTSMLGRPNMAEMSVDAAKRWGAEVVIVTSNPEGSRDVVKACKAKGISAYGPIWDS